MKLAEQKIDKKLNSVDAEISIIVVKQGNRFLLIKKKNFCDERLSWTFPGGKIEKGESSKQAAKRELFEETGISCKQLNKIGSRIHPKSKKSIDYFLCNDFSGRAINKEPKIAEAICWMPATKIYSIVGKDLYEPINYIINKIRLNKKDFHATRSFHKRMRANTSNQRINFDRS